MNKRRHVMRLGRFTAEQVAAIEYKAALDGMDPHDWVRSRILLAAEKLIRAAERANNLPTSPNSATSSDPSPTE